MSENSNVQVCEQQTPEVRQNPQHFVRIRPAIDVIEQDHGYLMSVEMPGVGADGVEVAVERGILSVKGTTQLSVPEGYHPVAGEFRTRVYERSFQLSDEIDRDSIEAEMKNGVLSLKLSKSQKALRTTVPVTSV